jgi:putative photosynthetic complex assembly protein
MSHSPDSVHTPPPAVPWPVWPLAALVLGSLLMVAWHQLGRQADPAPETAPVVWERSLVFEDLPNGDIGVIDASEQQLVAVFAGEQGFVRGTLRALARERYRRGLGPQVPFQLQGHADGRLTLADPATGERIALESFGPTNLAVYSQLRTARADAVLISKGETP